MLALANVGAAIDAEPISPIEVTVKKLPDLGDPIELQQRKLEKLEAETREIERDELATNREIWPRSGFQTIALPYQCEALGAA